MVQELIRFENRGRATKIYVAGIEIGKVVTGFSFNQTEKNASDPEMTITFGIRDILGVLAEITPEQLESAKEIIKPYIDGHKRTVTG